MNAPAAPQQLVPLGNLIKPDDVPKIPNFSDDTRAKYLEGVSKLWAQIRNLPPEHESYQAAHKKLSEVTTQIRIHLGRNRAQANAGGPTSAAQATTAQDARPQSQQPVLPNGQLKISQKVAQSAMSLPLLAPPNLVAQGQETAQKWVNEARQKYAQQLQRHETYQAQLVEIGQLVDARRREGKSISDQERQELSKQKLNAEGIRQQARDYMKKFKEQQDSFRSALGGANGGRPQPDGSSNNDNQGPNTGNGESKPPPQEPQSRQQPEHQGQAHTVSSALDAARQHAGSMERNATSPTNAQSSQASANQVPGLQNPQIKKEPSTSQMGLNITTDGAPQNSQHNSPQVGQPPVPSSQGPHPLSHQAAMASAAQKYAQHNLQQQSNPQSATHAHPPMPSRSDPQNNNVKFPIPKDLKVGAPQPVTMGPARPTLSGGPSNGAPGQMGLPAIPRHPGFVLEGEGDRVLSKKRLQQLMREVTGASEADDAEVMTPDVEEVRDAPQTQSHPVSPFCTNISRFGRKSLLTLIYRPYFK